MYMIVKRLFEVVNFVATTHPMGQKRCRSRDACQITSFIISIASTCKAFANLTTVEKRGRCPLVSMFLILHSETPETRDKSATPIPKCNIRIIILLRFMSSTVSPSFNFL